MRALTGRDRRGPGWGRVVCGTSRRKESMESVEEEHSLDCGTSCVVEGKDLIHGKA